MKKDDIRDSLEDNFLKICTFSPEINKRELVFNENSKSVYKRLFDDHSRRKYNSHLNKKKDETEFENLANKKHMKSLDKKRIEKLYNDHKRIKNNKNIMQQNYDIQDGITFKPNLPKEEKFVFNGDFYQRNELLLHKKNIFSDWYHKILKENIEGNKKYSENEAEEIKKNVVDRLYGRDLEKFKQRKSSLCQYEDAKFDYQSELRKNSNLYQQYDQQSYNESMNKSKSFNNNNLNEEKRNSKNNSVLQTKNISNLSNNQIKEHTVSINNDKINFNNNNNNRSNNNLNNLNNTNTINMTLSKQNLINNNNNENLSYSINDPNKNTVIHFKTDDPLNNNNNDYLITEIEANQKADASVKLPKGQNLSNFANMNINGNNNNNSNNIKLTNNANNMTNNSLVNIKTASQNQSQLGMNQNAQNLQNQSINNQSQSIHNQINQTHIQKNTNKNLINNIQEDNFNINYEKRGTNTNPQNNNNENNSINNIHNLTDIRSRGKNNTVENNNNNNMISQYLNNQNMNIPGKIKRRASCNDAPNNYNQNSNLQLNQMSSIASPQNIMSTKATNFNAQSIVNEEDRNNNSYSNFDMSSNNTIEKINNNLDNRDNTKNNNSNIEIK